MKERREEEGEEKERMEGEWRMSPPQVVHPCTQFARFDRRASSCSFASFTWPGHSAWSLFLKTNQLRERTLVSIKRRERSSSMKDTASDLSRVLPVCDQSTQVPVAETESFTEAHKKEESADDHLLSLSLSLSRQKHPHHQVE